MNKEVINILIGVIIKCVVAVGIIILANLLLIIKGFELAHIIVIDLLFIVSIVLGVIVGFRTNQA